MPNTTEQDPLISVIVPVYNVEPYIRKCIDSIVSQTYINLDIILIDDGSPDDSGRICDEYAVRDSRIRVIHKENGGLSSARNAGLDIAKGDYLMFVDSDDWVSPDFCEVACNLAIEKSADLIIFSHQVVRNCNEVLLTQTEGLDGYKSCEEAIDLILGSVGVYAWNKLYKRNLFCSIRFPNNRLFEDQPVTWKLIHNATRIYYTNKILYYYLMRQNSIIHQRSLKATKDLFEMKELEYKGLVEIGYSGRRLDALLYKAALVYAMNVQSDPNDQTGIRVHRILKDLNRIPSFFSWKQRILFFVYKKNRILFDAICILAKKRFA